MLHPIVREYISKIDKPIIFDIGAAGGTESFGLKSTFPKSFVYAFEPDPRNIRDWKSNAVPEQYKHISRSESIEWLKNIRLTESAVGSTVGTIDFYLSDGLPNPNWKHSWQTGWQYSSSFKKPKKHLQRNSWCTFNNVIKVPVTTLDHFCKQNNIEQIHLLWMDVQGAENDVIKGAENMFNKIHFIYAECMDKEDYEGEWSFDEMATFFVTKGWSIVERYEEDVLFKNDNLG